MTDSRLTVGILGAGRVGKAITALLRTAGYDVAMAGSLDDPGTVVSADVVVLAVPLHQYRNLPDLAGTLVIDAMNYWWELDGSRPEFEDATTSSSEVVALHLPGARIVKTLNHLSGYALEELARPRGSADRIAVAVAGDDSADTEVVATLVDHMGFEPVRAGKLADGVKFEPLTEAFGADASAAELHDMLERFWGSQRGRVVARARGL